MRRRRSMPAAIIAASEIRIIAKYRLVRMPIVSDRPTDGGLAGYLSMGVT